MARGTGLFPEQSSINRFLHQLGSQQRQQLELISEQLLQRFGLWQQSEPIDLDIDSAGLMVYGRTFEGISKGYFSRQRGRRSYRLSLATLAIRPVRKSSPCSWIWPTPLPPLGSGTVSIQQPKCSARGIAWV
jgi:hypothetical protein